MVAKNSKVCEKCKSKSVITLGYGPHYFCEKHFTRFFDDRVKKTIRKYSLFKPREKLLIAVSGGKDSLVVLHLIHKYYSKSNDIEVIIIDEGVKGYRNKAIKTAEKSCKKMKIKYKIISFEKEFGVTNDEIMPILKENPKLGGTCAFCGTMRRHIMNKYAKKLKADKLITGHNLDDETQSFVMNAFNNDFSRLIRTGARAGIIEHKGFVKRIKPLYETPEKEIIAYCAFNEIKHYSQECCPYSWTAKRNEYREMLNNFENRFPGTLFSLLRFNEQIKNNLKISKKDKQGFEKKLVACCACGEPTEKKLCKTCEMIKQLKQEKKNSKSNKNKTKTKSQTKDKKLKTTKKNKSNSKYNKKLTCATTKYNK
jgi:uncharacterized protein (TIGR00269 family)